MGAEKVAVRQFGRNSKSPQGLMAKQASAFATMYTPSLPSIIAL